MDEEQKKWHKQLSANFGAREFLRLGCAFVIWIFILVALSIAVGSAGYSVNSTSLIFSVIIVLSILAFPFLTYQWRPAYLLFRKILGNENLPTEPMPHSTIKIPRQPRPWWSYLPGIWFSLLTLLLLYLAIKYLSK